MTFRFEAYEEAGRIVCGVYDIKGTIKAGPRAFVAALREELKNLEQSAKANGAQEFRIGGRWGRRVAPDYEPFPIPADPLQRRKFL